MKKIVLWGASGHAKVLQATLVEQDFTIIGLIDRNKDIVSPLPGCLVFQSAEDMVRQKVFIPGEEVFFAVAVGGNRGRDRIEIHENLSSLGLHPVTLVHSRAWVAPTATLGAGAQVSAMAAVSVYARIGKQSIINTSASVDHECVIGEGCHIMPGATLAGCVEVGDFCTIGSNATILPRVRIGAGAFVGAGAVVTKDVAEGDTVAGVPAKRLSRNGI